MCPEVLNTEIQGIRKGKSVICFAVFAQWKESWWLMEVKSMDQLSTYFYPGLSKQCKHLKKKKKKQTDLKFLFFSFKWYHFLFIQTKTRLSWDSDLGYSAWPYLVLNNKNLIPLANTIIHIKLYLEHFLNWRIADLFKNKWGLNLNIDNIWGNRHATG